MALCALVLIASGTIQSLPGQIVETKWTGETNNDWNLANNWDKKVIPTANHQVIIPDKAKTDNDPILPTSGAVCYSITLEAGSILYSSASGKLEVYGGGESFKMEEQSTFDALNSKIIFLANKDISGKVLLTGHLVFYSITISNETEVQIREGCNIQIGATLSISNSGSLDASTFSNTIQFTGTSQSIPQPTGGAGGYRNLVILGIGAKLANQATVCENLTIESAGTMWVPAGKSLTVTGDLVNNGSLTVDSDAQGSGSLIVLGEATGSVTYKRAMSADGRWHLISFPVKEWTKDFLDRSSNRNCIATDPGNSCFSLASWDEQRRDWVHFQVANPANELIPGKGYEILLAGTTPQSLYFGGLLNQVGPEGRVAVGTESSSPLYPGWNLVGNPFTSYLSTNEILDANELMVSEGHVALYCWDPEADRYEVINRSNPATVAPGQGFFVKVSSASASIAFPAGARTHSASAFKSGTGWPAVQLIAATGSEASAAVIRLVPGTSAGLDPGYDAGRFEPGAGLALYTALADGAGGEYAVQCVSEATDNLIIPIGLNASRGTQVIFTTTATELPAGMRLYLEDRSARTLTRLGSSTNEINVKLHSDCHGTGRFYLHIGSATPVIPDDHHNPLTVIPLPDQGKIRVVGQVELPAKVSIHDLAGRFYRSYMLEQEGENELPVENLIDGVYVLKIVSSGKTIGCKFVWEGL
jgi:hypothetical protein